MKLAAIARPSIIPAHTEYEVTAFFFLALRENRIWFDCSSSVAKARVDRWGGRQ